MAPTSAVTKTQTRELTNAFLRSIYNWMALGLAITALAALFITRTQMGFSLLVSTGMMLPLGCLIATVVLSFVFGARINKMAATTATGLFLLFSLLMGIGLAPILLQYTAGSVAQAFITTAGMFTATSLYGLITKRDLASIGSYCMMGLFGLIIAMVVNFFFQSSMMSIIISLVGIAIFIGLTAYETQLYKQMGDTLPENDSLAVHRAAIMGALNLYMNFINMFLFLLRLMGDRR